MEKRSALAALAALSQETRLDIFRLLVQAGSGGVPAGRVGVHLGLPPATLSFHLNQLRHAGLVAFRREGRSLIYAAEYEAMNGLVGYLTENCCRGGGTCEVVGSRTGAASGRGAAGRSASRHTASDRTASDRAAAVRGAGRRGGRA